MVIKPIKLFLLLGLLFSYTLAYEEIQIEDDITVHKEDSQTYLLSFIKPVENYVHIEIKPTTSSQIIASTSKSDNECKKERNSLVMKPNGTINLFLKENKIPGGNEEYLCIQCLGNLPCQYDISIKKEKTCKLPLGDQYSYYVNTFTERMEFEFEYDPNLESKNLRELATVESRLNFWVKGQNKPKVIFDFQNTESEFGYGKICTTEYDKNNNYIIRIEAEEGDYITVGSHIIDDDIGKVLEVNNLEMMGILTKNDKEICFPIKKYEELSVDDVLRINGIVYTKKAISYYKLKGEKDPDLPNRLIEDGLIQGLIYPMKFEEQFCISHTNPEKTDLIFSIQLTSPSLYNHNQFIYPPHLPGVIYTHYLLKGEVAVIQGMQPKDGAREINFNMKARKGFPDMYFEKCTDYPNCEYNLESKHYKNPHHSNSMTVYSFYLEDEEKYTTISPFQPLMVINCLDADKEDEESFFCQFETSIFTNKDRLHLIEKQTFSQYLLKGEKDSYTISLLQEEKIKKVYLDLIVFSGDVDFQIETNIEAHKYFLSNKIFYSIQVKDGDTNLDFYVKAEKNSFYLVVFQYVYDEEVDDSENQNYIESGVNYIQSILIGDNAKYYKNYEFKNMRFSLGTPFFINFYSQNCDFVITRSIFDENENVKDVGIPVYDSYAQLVIDIDDPNFYTDKHTFRVDITGTDDTSYTNKKCMLYLTALEITNTNTGTERSISVSDGVPQYYIFTKKYPMIKYSFHVSDLNNAVVLNFNLIDKTTYKVQISFGHEKYDDEKTIYRNDQIYLYSSILKKNCIDEDEVCTINLNIELDNKNDEKPRKLETTIYQVNGAPVYLEKNAVKQDILLGKERKYYYLDIGKEEIGDITIDYKRGSGYIYGKIVKKNEKDKNPDWRGMYEFLKEKGGLEYQTYLKKLFINYDDTKDCDDGCYLLLTVENSVNIENPENDEKKALTPFRISITPRLGSSDQYLMEFLVPKVKIKVNEFVIGNLYPTSERIYEYFEVTFPFDGDTVYIDWQADKSSLLVNVGIERPKINESHFIFNSTGFDTIFKLTKKQILSVLNDNDENKKNNTLRNIHLTLGIHNSQVDTLYTSVYAFKVFMPPIYPITTSSFLSLVHIRSDQKVQCEPFTYNNKLACVFAVIFDEGDIGNNLVVYPRAQKENIELTYEGSLVDAKEIERNNMEEIYKYVKNLKRDYNSDNGQKYIYIQNIDRSKSLLFVVYVDKASNIEVLSSTYKFTNDQVFVPNPSSAQIFALGQDRIEFNFETSKDLLINIVSLSGDGYFYWDSDKENQIQYFLDGHEDRLTLTTGTDIADNRLCHLKAVSSTFTENLNDKSGFVFYMTFYPRNNEYNIDQLKVGRSTELNYRQVKFPLNFFAPISNDEISISVTFYNYYMDRDEKLLYDKQLFNIWGKVISESEAYDARFDQFYRPVRTGYYIEGTFDGAFATLYLSSEDLKQLNYDTIENPTLFFSLELNEDVNKNFKELGIEISISKENTDKDSDRFVSENVYYNDKLSNKKNPSKYTYKLRTNKNKPYMRIEFASNSDDIEFSPFYDESNSRKISGEQKNINGRYLYTAKINNFEKNYIYLTVSNNNNNNEKLTNYVFKYINGKDETDFASFEKDDAEIKLTKNEIINGQYQYSISFPPVEFHDVSYFIKGVYLNSKIKDEKRETIAISESKGYYIQLDNPTLDEDEKINVNFENLNKEISYIKVIAKANFDTTKEFLAYKPLIIKEETDYEKIGPLEGVIEINYDTQKKGFKGNAEDAYKIQKYKLKFKDKSEIPEYVKIELTSNDNNINKVISISPSQPDGKKDRIQLAQLGSEEKANTWIKNEQIIYEYFYIVVECQIEEGKRCNYLLEIKGEEYAEINSPNFNYNFYINEDNKEMKFKIINDNEKNNNQILTVFATGGKKIDLNLKTDKKKSLNGDNILIGKGITTRMETFEYFELTVNAEKGDYITIGSKIVIDKKSDYNTLNSNGYQLTGYLKTSTLEEECYLISDNNIDYNKNAFIVGLFYNKEGNIKYKDRNFKDLEEDSDESINGYSSSAKGYYTYIYNQNNNKRKYICISLPDSEAGTLIYSLQFTQPGKKSGLSNLYHPQLSGNIYPRMLEKGSYAFFNGINLDSNSDEIIYNMISNEGLPRMYIYKCENYPLCEFDNNNDKMTLINEINLMSTWHSVEKNSPIDANQYIMFVECEDLDDLSQSNHCFFFTSIYGNKDKIYLVEGKSFSQYIIDGQDSEYIIDISAEKDIYKIHVDILIINGDVDLTINQENEIPINGNRHILSNKIFYSIHKDENPNLERIFAKVKAKTNAYYIIDYKIVRTAEEELANKIHTGINYLIPIAKKENAKEKTITIYNNKLLDDESHYSSFYSLNCKFEIFRKQEFGDPIKIHSFGNYGEDIIEPEENVSAEKEYTYTIKLIDEIKTNLNEDYDMCMLYVSSVELMNEANYHSQKEILVNEGIPQRIQFMKLKNIKFIYPHTDIDKDVAINLKVINSAKFSFNLIYNNKESETKYFSSSKIEYINRYNIESNCGGGQICNIIVSIGVEEEIQEEENAPMLEISIRQIGNIPFYIPIGVARKDFVPASSSLNLFTILGQNNEGYINVDFARGSGLIYSKIVEIGGQGDGNPDWRQYQFPKSQDNTLKYDFYNKKIIFTKDDTGKCRLGCYLLISIKSSTTGNLDENYRFHQFSITVSLTPEGKLKDNGPIIEIEPEQYIVGSFNDENKIKTKDMYEFYQLNIPFNAKTVELDCQSDSAIFLINVGKDRPSYEKPFKKIESRSDTVFELTNDEILEQLIAGNYITNSYLTIGVYSEVMESPYGTSYSFRVHFTKEDLNIYKVDSDQKTLCKPKDIGNNEYRCLYMITYGEIDFIYDLMIYARSQNSAASISMYGDFIINTIYDNFERETLKEKIPTEGKSKFDTKRDQIDFIFLTLSDLDSHFYLSVISDKPDIIELLTSFKTFDKELSPNPSSAQLFAVNNGPSIKLKFKTTKPILINIVSLYGSSKLYFLEDKNVEYFIRGRDDRISLAIPMDGKEANLVVENRKYNDNGDPYLMNGEEVVMPGIAFYLEYFLRSDNLNLDEIYLGKTSEIAYKQSDFPLYYYSKLDNLDKDINIFFNFHDLELSSPKENIKYSPEDLTIRGSIESDNTVYSIRTGDKLKPTNDKSITGKYDPSLQAGNLFLPSDELKKFPTVTNPSLYLSFVKKNNNINFNRIRLELTAFEKKSEIPVTEKIYQYGNLKNNELVTYKLKVDNDTGDMRIQFASNSENVVYNINDKKDNKDATYELNKKEIKKERGKTFITFEKPKDKKYLYLHVFTKKDTDTRLNNYVFKYMNADKRESFFEYPINKTSKIKASLKDDILKVKFNKIEKQDVFVTYSLKVATKWDKSKDETSKTIAFTESISSVVQVQNPSDKDEITITMDDFSKSNFDYLEVIAQIKDGPIIEYVAYEPTKNIDEDDDDDKVLITVVSIVGSFIFLIVVVLIIIIVMYNLKTKDLLKQVNKISFADDPNKKSKTENLLLDDQNEMA